MLVLVLVGQERGKAGAGALRQCLHTAAQRAQCTGECCMRHVRARVLGAGAVVEEGQGHHITQAVDGGGNGQARAWDEEDTENIKAEEGAGPYPHPCLDALAQESFPGHCAGLSWAHSERAHAAHPESHLHTSVLQPSVHGQADIMATLATRCLFPTLTTRPPSPHSAYSPDFGITLF